jgi:hypothetical protein
VQRIHDMSIDRIAHSRSAVFRKLDCFRLFFCWSDGGPAGPRQEFQMLRRGIAVAMPQSVAFRADFLR